MTNFEQIEKLTTDQRLELLRVNGICPPDMVCYSMCTKVTDWYKACPVKDCTKCWSLWGECSVNGHSKCQHLKETTNKEYVATLSAAAFCDLLRCTGCCPCDIKVEDNEVLSYEVAQEDRVCEPTDEPAAIEECDKCWENRKNREALNDKL